MLFGLPLLSVGLSGCGGSGSGSPATGLLMVGNWGGALNRSGGEVWPATLTVAATAGQMTIACQGAAQYGQPVILDSNGHFSVTGTSTPCCTPVAVPTRFDGAVQNNVMTLTLTNAITGADLGTYTLRFGQDPPTQNVGCPG